MATVLVVDDSSTIRAHVVATLRADGHEVVEAPDGASGLAALRGDASIAAAVVDIHMPGMDGMQMLEAFAASGVLRLPVFIVSAESTEPMVARARALGVAGWFVKPLDTASLSQARRHLTT